MFASGGLFASEGAANVGFSQIAFALDSAKHKRDGEAFVNGRQSRCENTALGIERQSRWR